MRDEDPQGIAETVDEDVVGGGGRVTSDEAGVDFPPDRPHGVPFGDADVTDESLADRVRQEEPELTPDDVDMSLGVLPTDDPAVVDDVELVGDDVLDAIDPDDTVEHW